MLRTLALQKCEIERKYSYHDIDGLTSVYFLRISQYDREKNRKRVSEP